MLTRILASSVLALTVALHTARAEETTIDPAKGGPDFALQGEYVGDNCAAQVIALGSGKFHIVGWSHSLPGVNPEAERKHEVDAQEEGGKVVFNNNGFKGDLQGTTLTGTNDDGKTWKLTKTERKSPTLGAPAPQGSIVLFDGSNTDAWEGGKMDERHLLAGGTKTKQLFKNFTLHVEFRTPFMPAARGQGRGNSGVYLQNRYEVQVLDSFGLKGEDNECGGIYHQIKPLVNMAFPPLTWQTYDVDFQAAQFDAAGAKTKSAVVTLRHNGVLVHDHDEIKGGCTPGAGLKETAEPGPILLQNHGNPVFYRNLWIVDRSAAK